MSSKNVFFDFTIDSLVSVEAPEGTNPDTLIAKATEIFRTRLETGELLIMCEGTFDSTTGEYNLDTESLYEGVDK